MKLGVHVGLCPGHTVLDGDLAPTSPKGHTPQLLTRPNVWMNQDATWYEGRPRPRPYCVIWGPASPIRGTAPPNFRPLFIVAKQSPISASAEHLFLVGERVVGVWTRSAEIP